MVTLHVVYDEAVFFTSDEYFDKTGLRVNVQCEVGQPENLHASLRKLIGRRPSSCNT